MSAVEFRTPDSFISRYRSFPSRVRSPTPQKSDLPQCPFCTVLINSMRTTVLATPAQPNTLIFSLFFFQAEDGIRDESVTGVQTCLFRSIQSHSHLYAVFCLEMRV